MKRKNTASEKIEKITAKTIIVGIDIAKEIHWAKVTDYRGVELGKKPIKVHNSIAGFESLLENIAKLKQKNEAEKVIIGFEPSGHYWKALAWWLKNHESAPMLAGVNPYHTKQARELDDNSQTSNDKKDALTIARLIRNGQYFEIQFQTGEYAELRILHEERYQVLQKLNRTKNMIIAVLDEYYPELASIWKDLTRKTPREIMLKAAFPEEILALTKAELIEIIKDASNGTQGRKLAEKMIKTSETSIGVREGQRTAKMKLDRLISELKFHEESLAEIEQELKNAMEKTELSEILESMPGVGTTISTGFCAEIGDLSRYDDWKQLRRLAGLNLVEDSSGKHVSKTKISKRGRPHLRHIVYLAGKTCMRVNLEMREYYKYLRERPKNPLRGKQALIAVGLKVMRILFYMAKNREKYDPTKALGEVRKQQIESLKSA
jgi:transposase